jgi:hypothetical protein
MEIDRGEDRMKSLPVKLGVILIGLFIFGYAEVRGEDWKEFARNERTFCYYDAESISQPSKNIIKVGVKFEYTKIGIAEFVKTFGDKFNKLDNSKSLYEVNCVEKKYRILELVFYSKDGIVLDTISYPSEWTYNTRESVSDALDIKVCK